MGILWWVFCIMLAIVICLLMLPVGIKVHFLHGAITFFIKIGPLTRQISPREKTDEKSHGKEGTNEKKYPKPASGKKNVSASFLWESVQVLWPSLKKTLSKGRRAITIDPLHLCCIIGGREDPAQAAKLFGWLQMGVWTVMPLLEQGLRIPDAQIHIGMDFQKEPWDLTGEVGISARIGSLVSMALSFAIPVLRWLKAYHKQQQAAPLTQGTAA